MSDAVVRGGKGEYAHLAVALLCDGGGAAAQGGTGGEDIIDKQYVLALYCLGGFEGEDAFYIAPALVAAFVGLAFVGYGACNGAGEHGDACATGEAQGYVVALVVASAALFFL